MAEAALAMRDVMPREEEPSFVIKDPRYVKESTNTTSLLHNIQWQMVGVVGGDSHEFCLRPADLHPPERKRGAPRCGCQCRAYS